MHRFPAPLPFFKCILEVVFCEGVQHRLRFCLNHLNYLKMAAFQFLSSIKETEKSRVGGVDSHVVFLQKLLVKKEV
jgi:hypothetical protein